MVKSLNMLKQYKVAAYSFVLFFVLGLSFGLYSCAEKKATAHEGHSHEQTEKYSLFINLISDDPHRVKMAVHFAKLHLKNNKVAHLTLFLNDRAVFAASKRSSNRYPTQQTDIAELFTYNTQEHPDRVSVIVCPMCMDYYGVSVEDFFDNRLKTANIDIVSQRLSELNVRTMTW
ncbi:MAG: DsrE family protein [Candidatus Calescibacterium sp.]|nr:DsrE family protein [Candidatus Calescibacterium sp.]